MDNIDIRTIVKKQQQQQQQKVMKIQDYRNFKDVFSIIIKYSILE
jgi:hypothetical protein